MVRQNNKPIITILRRYSKVITAFLVINFLTSLVYPMVSYALTAGPTNPDYTSFEPIDTTDMVNPLSGDLTYNLPLLEVPGPGGGYPLSLSYHAGILPNEEASWVGLGWTLNPGAINRSVNGFADDHKNVTTTDRFFWEGGSRSQLDVGVTAGISGIAGASGGISLGVDTYQGFGIGLFQGVSVGFGKSGFGLGYRHGFDPWGERYQSIGISYSKDVNAVSLSVGANTNFESVNFSGGISANYNVNRGEDNQPLKGSTSLMGASISSKSKGISASIVGATGIVNNKTENISTRSFGLVLPLPLIYLGYKNTRYWINETESIATNGALYYPNTLVSEDWLDDHSYDTYHAVDENDFTISGFPEFNAAKSVGGSFVNYDHYAVTGQGVSGNIKPYKMQQHLLNQNITEGEEVYQLVTGYDLDQSFTWRFIDDFSNRYEYDPSNFSVNFGQLDASDFNFSSPSAIGEPGENPLDRGLSGSRSIKAYTNAQITTGVTGFIENRSSGFNETSTFRRNELPQDQIGAYVITNESGVSYHYTLPAYNYDEFLYSENIERGQGHTYNEQKRPEPYSYNWHLTAVTGPDFVDRGTIGELDEQDWGYWVEFEYGKWTDQYYWRNPGEGMDIDLDNNFQNFSEGTKELYYLDAIRTKTHTALFVKDIRQDSKSGLKVLMNENIARSTPHAESFEGGFEEKTVTCFCDKRINRGGGNPSTGDKGTITYTARPTSTLRLDKIILLQNSDITSINKSLGSEWGCENDPNCDFSWDIEFDDNIPEQDCDFSDLNFDRHLYQNVYDIHDENNSQFEQMALRVIDFDNDHYELVPSTSNSTSGKLTLKSVAFKGKSGSSVTPPMNFDYDLDQMLEDVRIVRSAIAGENKYTITLDEGNDSNFEVGDIIKTSADHYFLLIERSNANNDHLVRYVGPDEVPPGGTNALYYDGLVNESKNPPHNAEYYDNWGMYKVDFDPDLCDINEVIGRSVTDLSSRSLDVWSLRKITTALGASIEIDYGSDKYSTVASLRSSNIVTVDKIRDQGNDLWDIYIHETALINDYFEVGDVVDLSSVFGFRPEQHESYDVFGRDNNFWAPEAIVANDPVHSYPVNVDRSSITQIGSDYIRIESTELSTLLNGTKELNRYGDLAFRTNISDPFIGQDEKDRYSLTFNEYPQFFYGGFVSSPYKSEFKGGGIVVNSITTRTANESDAMHYTYEDGVTSYLPFNLIPGEQGEDAHTFPDPEEIVGIVERNSYHLYSPILKNSREIPAPGVLYGTVTSRGYANGNQLPKYEVMEFNTFHSGMVGFEVDSDADIDVTDNNWSFLGKEFKRQRARKIYKKDFSSQVGTLKRTTVYDLYDNKIFEQTNEYLHDLLDIPDDATDEEYFYANQTTYAQLLNDRFRNQGLLEETFADSRLIKNVDQYEMLGVISKSERYPSVLINSSTTNHLTGATQSTSNLGFDFYSGQTTYSLVQDESWNYLNVLVPAYRNYPEMTDQNMLIQESENHTYSMSTSAAAPVDYDAVRTFDSDAVGLVSASAKSWTNDFQQMRPGGGSATANSNIWIENANYSWIGENDPNDWNDDGTYKPNQFSKFNFTSETNPGWQKNGEITLYNVYSHVLEAEDVNGNFAASKMDLAQERVLTRIANAKYAEFAFTGVEDGDSETVLPINYGGNVTQAAGERVHQFGDDGVFDTEDDRPVHTGLWSIKTTTLNERVVQYTDDLIAGKSYRAMVWCTEENGVGFAVEDSEDQDIEISMKVLGSSDGWYLHEAIFHVDGTYGSLEEIDIYVEGALGVTKYVDDFRVQPADASMTAYVYNEWGELSHVLDQNNLFTHYEYDQLGRLKSVSRETFQHGVVKVSEQSINYARAIQNN